MEVPSIQYVSTRTELKLVKVYEVEQPGLPSLIFVHADDMPIVGKCNAIRKQVQLSEPVLTMQLQVPIMTYRLRCNELDEAYRIFAHYGLFCAASLDFDATNALPSTDTNFMHEMTFDVIDLQALFDAYPVTFNRYQLLQQLSFDIAEYDQDGRRLDIQSINSTTSYAKLTTRLSLRLNQLTILAVDTQGRSITKYLSDTSGIAEESMQCYCRVKLESKDGAGGVLDRYEITASTPNADDSPLVVVLPNLALGAKVATVYTKYIVDINTTGDTVELENKIILTDEQLAGLMLKFGLGTGMDINDLLARIEQQQVVINAYAQRHY